MRRGHNKKQGLMKTNTWMKMGPGGGEVKLKREIGGEGSPTHFQEVMVLNEKVQYGTNDDYDDGDGGHGDLDEELEEC